MQNEQNELKALDSNKFLDFQKANVQIITLGQLGKTYKENDVYGKPLRGMHHIDLLNALCEQATAKGLSLEIYDLFAANNKERQNPGVALLPQIEAIHGAQAVEAHILRRVYANIRIKDLDTDEYTTNLAVSYSQKGVQMALGNNVKICHNQCMLGQKDFYITSFADTKGSKKDERPVTEFPAVFGQWLETFEEEIQKERARIEKMKNTILTTEQLFQLLGMLQCIRVAADSKIQEIKIPETYPLNGTQLNKFTEQIMVLKHKQNQVSVWDFYNTATELYKPTSAEIPNILPQNKRFVEFMEENELI